LRRLSNSSPELDFPQTGSVYVLIHATWKDKLDTSNIVEFPKRDAPSEIACAVRARLQDRLPPDGVEHVVARMLRAYQERYRGLPKAVVTVPDSFPVEWRPYLMQLTEQVYREGYYIALSRSFEHRLQLEVEIWLLQHPQRPSAA
jgi:hypothetical protein